MVAFLGFVVAMTLVMWLAPGSDAARALNRHLVERPFAALADLKRHHLLFFVIMAGFAIGGGEAMALLGPEFVAGYALDLAIYLDAVMVTYALSALAIARRGGGRIKLAVMRTVRRMRPRGRRATRRPARPRPSANDDDGPAPVIRCAA